MHHTLFETKDKTMFLTFTIKLLLLVFFYDSWFSTKKHITKHVFFGVHFTYGRALVFKLLAQAVKIKQTESKNNLTEIWHL